VTLVVFRFLKPHPGEMTRLLWAAFLAGPIVRAVVHRHRVENVANVAVASAVRDAALRVASRSTGGASSAFMAA
jgi:hypothetical protein